MELTNSLKQFIHIQGSLGRGLDMEEAIILGILARLLHTRPPWMRMGLPTSLVHSCDAHRQLHLALGCKITLVTSQRYHDVRAAQHDG